MLAGTEEAYLGHSLIDLVAKGFDGSNPPVEDNRAPDGFGDNSANFMPNFFINPSSPAPSWIYTKDDIIRGQYDVLLNEFRYDFKEYGAFE
jgi:hypothetical protein